jgi:hypothetical protein
MSNGREVTERSIVKSVEEAAGVYCDVLYQNLLGETGRLRNMLMLSVPRFVLEPVASVHHECYALNYDIQRENLNVV